MAINSQHDHHKPEVRPPVEPASLHDAAEEHYPVDKIVFGVAAGLVLAFIVWGVASTDTLSAVASSVLSGVITGGGWAFVLAASGFVVFAIWLAISKYGRIPLGQDDETPEFRTVSWIAMMFSAGMGIGLMFYGVGEPLAHFTSPPPGTAAPGTPEAFDIAMATTLFHWTLHPWSIYAVVGLAIAYSTFRCGRRQLISSTFAPLLGQRGTEGAFGRAIDILAIFATLFGSAASLGLGALQIGGGLQAAGYMDNVSTTLLVAIIIVLTLAFIASAVSGVAKGIQWLSNINMVLAGVLALVVFIGGPTILILNLMPTMIGDYFRDLAEMAARTAATGGDATGELAVRVDGLLLGLVDLLDAVRRHVHRPDQPRPHDPPVHRRGHPHPQRGQPALVRDLRWVGDRRPAQRGRPRLPAHRGPAVRAAGHRCLSAACSGSSPCCWSRSSSSPAPTRPRS